MKVMKVKSYDIQQSSRGRLKNQQSGMTLIEVLVAMVVLALGILALLATQLRTVSGVAEAQSQTVAAQAVQNLIEGMLANPTATAVTKNGNETGWKSYSYAAYHKTGTAKQTSITNKNEFTKSELAASQLAEFENALLNVSETPARYTIAANATGDTVITVTWGGDDQITESYTYSARVSQ
ncbi:type IV pilus modification protein PilV [Neisseria sp. S1]|uniref:type IV pilus modification protein PilV n=1 Tax=Neisseria sp. S1 TaxID=3318354 RepID=UPI003A8C7405